MVQTEADTATPCLLPPVTPDRTPQNSSKPPRRDFPPVVVGALPRSWLASLTELGRGHRAKHFSNFSKSAGWEECAKLFMHPSELPSMLKRKEMKLFMHHSAFICSRGGEKSQRKF